MRQELAEAAAQGIRQYLDSTRGANLFGASAQVTHVGVNSVIVSTSRHDFEMIVQDRE
jgi:hypothetical protein